MTGDKFGFWNQLKWVVNIICDAIWIETCQEYAIINKPNTFGSTEKKIAEILKENYQRYGTVWWLMA